MKVVGMCLVLLGCVGIGFYYRIREVFRYRNLQELLKAMVILRGEIASMHTPLPDALLQSAKRTKGIAAEFFSAVAGELEEGGGELCVMWQNKLRDCVPVMQLREEDRRELEALGETLGYLDVEMQIQSIELYRRRLEYSIKGMEKESDKRCRLYPVLGTVAGIVLCILIV